MKDLDGSGHVYDLAGEQRIVFKFDDGHVGHGGTTNEELIEVLIDRLGKLNKTVSCRENREVIICLHKALTWLESRSKKRMDSDHWTAAERAVR